MTRRPAAGRRAGSRLPAPRTEPDVLVRIDGPFRTAASVPAGYAPAVRAVLGYERLTLGSAGGVLAASRTPDDFTLMADGRVYFPAKLAYEVANGLAARGIPARVASPGNGGRADLGCAYHGRASAAAVGRILDSRPGVRWAVFVPNRDQIRRWVRELRPGRRVFDFTGWEMNGDGPGVLVTSTSHLDDAGVHDFAAAVALDARAVIPPDLPFGSAAPPGWTPAWGEIPGCMADDFVGWKYAAARGLFRSFHTPAFGFLPAGPPRNRETELRLMAHFGSIGLFPRS